MKKIKKKICKINQFSENGFFRTWIREWKDEIIIFKYNKKIYIKSGICPHFGGPIEFNKKNKYLKCS